ncbi:MAG: CDP-alcohol phosphatidyltransferase family protein [archaeon]|nr:CDP-alcohol phosphatidyltransferase family protein [archaeon]
MNYIRGELYLGLNDFRYISDKVIEPPVKLLIRYDVSPNMISIIGFIFSIFAAISYALPEVFMYQGFPFSWIPVLLFIFGGVIDLLDGGVARKSGQVSKYGGFLDSVLDRLSDAAILLGIMYSGIIWPSDSTINDIIAYIAVCTSILISYTRTRAENEGVIMKGVGFMERAERIVILIIGYIIEAILSMFTPLGSPGNTSFYSVFFIVFTILCLFTFIQRIVHTRKWFSGNLSDKFLEKNEIKEEYRAKFPKI